MKPQISIQKIAERIKLCTLTLPTIQDGFRLLPAGKEFQHSDKMKEFAAQHAKLKAAFLRDYASERASAPIRLNGLYDARHWPDETIVADKFAFRTRYLACPFDGAWGDWLAETAELAHADLAERLTEALSHVVARCKADNGEAKLYQSVFSNLAEVCELVPDLNICDDLKIDTAALSAFSLGTIDAEKVRDDKPARMAAADKAQSILKALGAQ